MQEYYSNFFKEKCNQGELWLPYCPRCQKAFFYPRGQCPFCLEEGWQWMPASGRGKVYSYTTVRVSALDEFKEATPYVYALIDLEEGVRLASNVVKCPEELLQPDLPVKLTWVEREGRRLPVFTPVEGD
ncbi:MAG: OB-fold domain-containing protein [Syntrophomonadaceae bacterium]